MNKKVLITGTSSGIGLACVEKFVESGFHVTATVRKSEDEKRLKKKKIVGEKKTSRKKVNHKND